MKVHYTVKQIVSLGNYEAVHIEAGAETVQKEGETVSQAFKRVSDVVEVKVNADVAAVRKQLKK